MIHQIVQDNQNNFDFDTLCKKVFDLDDKIRSVRVINNKGNHKQSKQLKR